MSIFVTGGAGFVGSHLVRRLAPEHSLKVLLLPHEIPPYPTSSNIEIVRGDVRDKNLLVQVTRGVQTIFHTAALVSDWGSKKQFFDINVRGTQNLLDAALTNHISRFVAISTNDVFGLQEGVLIDETFPLNHWGEPYSDSKIEAEKLVSLYHRQHGLDVTWVYPCWVYGPGDRTFLPLLADAILKKEMIYWRRATTVWPTYIDNLIDLLVLISQHPKAVGHGFLVHDGISLTLESLCERIAHHFQVKPPRFRIPYGLAYGMAVGFECLWKLFRIQQRPLLTTYAVKNLGSRLQFSIEKAKQRLGWMPKMSFDEGIKESLTWLGTLNPSQLKLK